MAHEEFEEAVAAHALEALEPLEREALEAHLRTGCAACRTALRDYRAVSAMLPYGLVAETVPRELKWHLMTAFVRDFPNLQDQSALPQREPRSARPDVRSAWSAWVVRPAFTVAAALLLIGVVSYAWFLRAQVDREVAQRQQAEVTLRSLRAQIEADLAQRRQLEAALRSETERLAVLELHAAAKEGEVSGTRQELAAKLGQLRDTVGRLEAELGRMRAALAQDEQEAAALKTALAQRDEILAFLRSPRVKVVTLSGSEEAKGASAFLLFDPESRKAFFYAFNMPPLPEGKTYQLWAIVDQPVSAGTFGIDAGQKSRALIPKLPDLSRITKFAVSLEPEGGRPQPTGNVLLVGQL